MKYPTKSSGTASGSKPIKLFLTLSTLLISTLLVFSVFTTSANAEESMSEDAADLTATKNTQIQVAQMGKNPCSSKSMPIRKKQVTNYKKLLKYGKKLWNDEKFGKAKGTSCNTCHPNGALLNSKPYPKYIKMAGEILTVDQMINFCMINPMKTKALKWNSKEMTAIAAYIAKHTMTKSQGKMKHDMMNPCMKMKNPCNKMMNPCSGM
ncbi:MAG: hypothetical protein KAT46_01505 [Deltaproteobacteria bacterium]|nr:hypothetical protein [Deltaproteobacteria bacterium]